ncbi:MAG: cofactor-independent phosphoglycerate mutase [Promethearchaeota archaeon]
MKYAILVCDGAADWPIPELGNKTIFEVAKIPNMDYLAQNGKMGLLKTIPDSMEPGSECANMTILGYNPETDLTGRGPLEALSAGVKLDENDIAFRCNLITIRNDLIKDYSAGHISTEEAKELINSIDAKLGKKGVSFFPGVQYRHILRLDGNQYSEELILTPPHNVIDRNYLDHLPKPRNKENGKAVKTAELLNKLIKNSSKILKEHPINIKRVAEGKNPATHVWFWSGGKKPAIKSFKEKYGLTGGVISAVDLIFGLGIAAGLKPVHVKGATGLPDTNYVGKAEAGLKILEKEDFILIHVEATDEMGHAGDYKRKIKALEDFDKFIVGKFIKAEEKFNNEIVICVLPDHPTPCSYKTHVRDPVPFVIYSPKKAINKDNSVNKKQNPNKNRQFSEESGKKGELGLIENGESFMKILLSF